MWPHFTADELIILFSSVQALTHDQLQASPFSALPVVVVEMILHRSDKISAGICALHQRLYYSAAVNQGLCHQCDKKHQAEQGSD